MPKTCIQWIDSQCDLPAGHDGPCYNNADDIIWREPNDEERLTFRRILSAADDE